MENLEILKGIVSDETYAALEAETKDSKNRQNVKAPIRH